MLAELINNFAQKQAAKNEAAAKVLEQERAFSEQMDRIEIFPGNLDEYQKLRGGKYELVDTRWPLEGGLVSIDWKELKWELARDRVLELKIGSVRIKFLPPTLFAAHAILVKAAELNADAIIHYQQNRSTFSFWESGIPVKKVAGNVQD